MSIDATFVLSYLCSPGRFFAANELKAMLAHLVLTYDVKMENDGVIPEPFWFGMKMIPNPNAEIMYRRRKSTRAV